MKTIGNIKRENLKNPEYLDYYRANDERLFNGKGDPREVIRDYFAYGGKERIISGWTGIENNQLKFRYEHSINVFNIGAYIQNQVDKDFYVTTLYKKNKTQYPFSYVWFLTSLAHDLGYVFETDGELKGKITIKQRELQYLEPKYHNFFAYRNMCYRALGILGNEIGVQRIGQPVQKWYKEFERIKLFYKDDKRGGGKIRYSNKLFDNYLRYIMHRFNQLDHGIAGGDFFMIMIIKEYNTTFNEAKEYNNLLPSDYEGFDTCDGLRLQYDQFEVFRLVRNCIMEHNIFKASGDYEDVYREFDLEELIGKKYQKVSYSLCPILFDLCVADTMEPYKRFKKVLDIVGITKEELLDLIYVDFDGNILKVKVDSKLRSLCKNIFADKDANPCERYIDDLESLPDWCDIKVEVLE
ncbi:MAG: hypothetical protein K6E70_03840 [Butyrivibrio sp.]|nr:hypothetical protein [Butyrivibrio sp.]